MCSGKMREGERAGQCRREIKPYSLCGYFVRANRPVDRRRGSVSPSHPIRVIVPRRDGDLDVAFVSETVTSPFRVINADVSAGCLEPRTSPTTICHTDGLARRHR